MATSSVAVITPTEYSISSPQNLYRLTYSTNILCAKASFRRLLLILLDINFLKSKFFCIFAAEIINDCRSMIIDSLEVLDRYEGLNPLFKVVVDFIRKTDLTTLPTGKTVIQGDDIYVNVMDAPVKGREEARFETHRDMIDIQVPFDAPEEHGWAPAAMLPQARYDESIDMTLHDPELGMSNEALASTYFTLKPGQFAIYFPTDGHAPAITATGLRKAIFKVKVN